MALSDLHDLQGSLKTLTDENYAKLRNSITEFGFSAPFFYWQDETGTKWITDGHQRDRVLRRMQEEGFIIPPLPACPVFAKDRREAKKKLLALNSRYGKIDESGMVDYLNEPGFEIDVTELEDFVDFPEIELGDEKPGVFDDKGPKEPEEIECPECHAKFSLK